MAVKNTQVYEKALSEWKKSLLEALAFNAFIGMLSGALGAWVLTSYAPIDLTFFQAFFGLLPLLLLLMFPPVFNSVGPKPRLEDFGVSAEEVN